MDDFGGKYLCYVYVRGKIGLTCIYEIYYKIAIEHNTFVEHLVVVAEGEQWVVSWSGKWTGEERIMKSVIYEESYSEYLQAWMLLIMHIWLIIAKISCTGIEQTKFV